MENSSDSLSTKELFKLLRLWSSIIIKRWVLILIFSFLGGVIGLLIATYQPKSYVAKMSFVLQDEKEGGALGGALGIASQIGIDLGSSGGGTFSGANLIELMKTRSMIEKTLLTGIKINNKEYSLAQFYIEMNRKKNKFNEQFFVNEVSFPANADRSKFTRLQDSVLYQIYNRLKDNIKIAQVDKKVSILKLEFKSNNEMFSKIFAENLLSIVSRFYSETKSKKAYLNVSILEKQADSVRKELNNALNGVAFANEQTFNLNNAYTRQRIPSTRNQIDVQANSTILTQLVANLEIARVSLRKETPLVEIIDHPILPLEIIKLGRLKSAFIGAFLTAIICIGGILGNFLMKTSK